MAVAILRTRLEDPIDFTCADGVAIPKGTLLKITNGRVAAAADGAGDIIAGICARDKIASDGRTTVPVFVRGIFDMEADGSFSTGGPVMADGTGSTIIASTGVAGAAHIGYALEDATDGDIVQIMVLIGASGAIA
jgi:hypothetical protein